MISLSERIEDLRDKQGMMLCTHLDKPYHIPQGSVDRIDPDSSFHPVPRQGF